MSSSEEKDEVEASVEPSLKDDLKNFLTECEKDFCKRYTEEEEEFSVHLNKKPSTPPIVYPWHRSQQNYRHGRGNYSRNYDQRDRHDNRNRHDDRNRHVDRSRHDDRNRHDHRDRYDSRSHHFRSDNWRRNNDGGRRGNHYKPY